MIRITSLVAVQVLLVDHIKKHINLPGSPTWPMHPSDKECKEMADGAAIMSLITPEEDPGHNMEVQVWVNRGQSHFRFTYQEHRGIRGYEVNLLRVESLKVTHSAAWHLVWEKDITVSEYPAAQEG